MEEVSSPLGVTLQLAALSAQSLSASSVTLPEPGTTKSAPSAYRLSITALPLPGMVLSGYTDHIQTIQVCVLTTLPRSVQEAA